MRSVSDIFRELHSGKCPPDHHSPAAVAGAQIAAATYGGRVLSVCPAIVNIGACYHLWRRTRSRTIWRVAQPTGEYLSGVGLSFLPEIPPESWGGDAIVIESASRGAIVGHYFSVFAYFCPDRSGQLRYYFGGLDLDGGICAVNIRADIGEINRRLADSGRLLDCHVLSDAVSVPLTADQQLAALELLQFIFATSYYVQIAQRDIVDIRRTPGVPLRNARGKAVRSGGRPATLWTYADLRITPRTHPRGRGAGEKMDLAGMELSPVIVRPHLRRLRSGKVVIVDAYDAHRWRRAEKIGAKKTI